MERAKERIPTRNEILGAMLRFAGSTNVTLERPDAEGIYLLEVTIEGKEKGETLEYQYIRKGRHANGNQESETSIHVTYCQDGMPISGDKVASYNPRDGSWNSVNNELVDVVKIVKL